MHVELPALTDQQLDELQQSISNEKRLRQAEKRKRMVLEEERDIVYHYMDGFVMGLLWPDRWVLGANPGGPHVHGITKDALDLSQRCNDAWREAFKSGIGERVRLQLQIPDHLMRYSAGLKDTLMATLRILLWSDGAIPDLGFEVGDHVAVDDSPTKGTIIHKISLSTREFTIYLVKIKNELNFVFRGGYDLRYYCEKKCA